MLKFLAKQNNKVLTVVKLHVMQDIFVVQMKSVFVEFATQ